MHCVLAQTPAHTPLPLEANLEQTPRLAVKIFAAHNAPASSASLGQTWGFLRVQGRLSELVSPTERDTPSLCSYLSRHAAQL